MLPVLVFANKFGDPNRQGQEQKPSGNGEARGHSKTNIDHSDATGDDALVDVHFIQQLLQIDILKVSFQRPVLMCVRAFHNVVLI